MSSEQQPKPMDISKERWAVRAVAVATKAFVPFTTREDVTPHLGRFSRNVRDLAEGTGALAVVAGILEPGLIPLALLGYLSAKTANLYNEKQIVKKNGINSNDIAGETPMVKAAAVIAKAFIPGVLSAQKELWSRSSKAQKAILGYATVAEAAGLGIMPFFPPGGAVVYLYGRFCTLETEYWVLNKEKILAYANATAEKITGNLHGIANTASRMVSDLGAEFKGAEGRVRGYFDNSDARIQEADAIIASESARIRKNYDRHVKPPVDHFVSSAKSSFNAETQRLQRLATDLKPGNLRRKGHVLGQYLQGK